MTRPLSYAAPQLLAVYSPTVGRREDLDRGTLWTDREIAWLIANYAKKPAWYCGQKLRRSEQSVKLKAYRLGLDAEPPAEYLRDSVAEFKRGVRELAARLQAQAAE